MTGAANEYERADHERDLRKHEDTAMKYRIILQNVGDKIDEQVVIVNDEPELTAAVIDFIEGVETLRNGDVIRIVEMEPEP